MQYGPDGTPISSETILVGPPTTGPTAVPSTTTVTEIGPPVYEPGATLINELNNVKVEVPYAVTVLDEGNLITNKATVLNFVGNAVTATGLNGNVSIIIGTQGVITDIIAGAGIAVDTANNISTITNNGVISITAGQGIRVTSLNNISTVTNTFTESVYTGGSWSGAVSPNRNNGIVQKFTLTGNITLGTPTNVLAGQSLTLILTQDATGNRSLTADTSYLFAGGYNDLSTGAGDIDMLNIFFDGSAYYVTLTTSYV